MGELRALLWIVLGVFKLVYYLIAGIVKLIVGAARKLEQLGDEELKRRRGEGPGKRAPQKHKAARQAAQQGTIRPARLAYDVADALRKRSRELADAARALAGVAAQGRNTRRFVATLDALAERAGELDSAARRGDGARAEIERGLARDELLLEITNAMIAERRTPALGELLGDTDALATASYAPIVAYCRDRGIPLSSDRAATIVGGDKIYFLSVDDPSGLAAIVVPDSFTSEIIAWPAISHEIAHDFYRSVRGLPDELRAAVKLGSDLRVPSFNGDVAALERTLVHVPQRAVSAWQEELFADAFGTLMLGPAYVQTMAALFATPADPMAVYVMAMDGEGPQARYEDHPPGHVRVVVACRLLGKMGYGRVGDEIEGRWRKRHTEHEQLYVPLAEGRYAVVPEGPTIARASDVADTMYMTGLKCLRGQPLRSIPGLDFGPREHQQALRAAKRFGNLTECRPVDARVLTAGAVLATVERPDRANEIYVLAREAIIGLDATRPVERAVAVAGGLGEVDVAALREAFILDELLRPPPSRRLRQRS